LSLPAFGLVKDLNRKFCQGSEHFEGFENLSANIVAVEMD
jgi:hypothetical protein